MKFTCRVLGHVVEEMGGTRSVGSAKGWIATSRQRETGSRVGKAEVAGMEKRGDDSRGGGIMRLVDGGADDVRLDKSIGIICQRGT
jgi:hypothetical protein